MHAVLAAQRAPPCHVVATQLDLLSMNASYMAFCLLESHDRTIPTRRPQALLPGTSLAQDVRGSWSVAADPFKGVTTLRR